MPLTKKTKYALCGIVRRFKMCYLNFKMRNTVAILYPTRSPNLEDRLKKPVVRVTKKKKTLVLGGTNSAFFYLEVHFD